MKRVAAIAIGLSVAGAIPSACSGVGTGREAVPGTGRVAQGGARATADRLPPPPDPLLAPAPSPAAAPGARPVPGESLQACVDRELARRGLNPYGDVAGTVYPHGPPVPPDSTERYDLVLRRFPDLRTACQASTPFR